ncbi:DedA family protein [Mycolicibacterium baixiangningiae]|uniref:DedA family protein n=1 Tax=Mycolicibacterium baixiangningiae TaxID=2761578 RepID=UPI001867D5F4|nr:DedA family protein [Mycolicibacterium baixiangningiae]
MDVTTVASEAQQIGGVAGWAVEMMERLGGFGAGVAIAAENLFPPIPSEVVLPLAGFAAARGDMTVLEAIIWTTAGSVVGAMLLYLAGVAFGRDRVYRLAERIPLFSADDLATSEAWFHRHGTKAVLFGRMVPVVRSLVSVPAGLQRMPIIRFIALTAAGSAVWNTLLILAGYHLGVRWETVSDWLSRYQLVVFTAVGVAVAVWLVRRMRARSA